jgi:nitroimidazol reductase NimA-like FMN-containing flavoprotein (pyridoxamine 5'-phosphate oxidase superfamily)
MRRKDRALDEQEAYAILREGGDGVLATWGEDGYPYAVPMNHAVLDGAIYLHSAISGHKLENLAFCDRVSYCVVSEREVVPAEVATNYSSAIVFGRAVVLEDRDERRKGLMALLDRFCPEHMDAGMRELENEFEHTAVVRIDVHRITGKARRKADY